MLEDISKVEESALHSQVDEKKSSCEATVHDASTQTPQVKRRRRRGGVEAGQGECWLSNLC